MSAEMNQWILDTMISMTLLMAFVLLIRKPVSHYFGAKVAYALWALPVARLFMPILTLEGPAIVETVEPSGVAAATISELAMVAPTEQINVSALASVDWFLIALVVWVGGAGMLFISKLASYTQFREDIVSDGQLVGRHGNIRILETAAVGGPLAFGLFQKYIAVPTNFFRIYSPRERELVLEHEIAHHEAGDLFANFAGLLLLSLHWFNPVAWFAWVAFREDQETACDARILQKSGREVRAVYGRTIAKSASGHQLGFVSPLNQKDKIKGRLKMLGKGEQSGFRKKLGMLMVGASTIVALPATATVVYTEAIIVEEAEPVSGGLDVTSDAFFVFSDDKLSIVGEEYQGKFRYRIRSGGQNFEFLTAEKLTDEELDRRATKLTGTTIGSLVPPKPPSLPRSSVSPKVPSKPVSPEWPEPVSRDSNDDVVNVTMLNGSKDFKNDEQFVHRIKHDGRTIVLRTNQRLSAQEIREQVREAEESRREADAELREQEREIREQKWEMKEQKREMHLEMREMERELEEARREVSREMRETQREVERSIREAERAAKRAKRHTTRVWSIANQVSEISFAPKSPRAPQPVKPNRAVTDPQLDCASMNKQFAFGGRKNQLTNHALAAIAGCGTFKVTIDEKKLMKITLRDLERGRAEAAKCSDNEKLKSKKLRAFDRDIKKLKARLSMT
ncbi:MAG: M56 family metallopeptidase [Parasphingorhabdus sp.]